MRVATAFLVLALGYGSASLASTAEPRLTVETSLPPLQISLSDLKAVLDKSRHIVLRDAGPLPYVDRLEISDGVRTFRIAGDASQDAMRGAPRFASAAHYLLERQSGDVTEINLDLRDSSRKVSVGGASEAEVEAVSQFLVSQLQDYRVRFQGLGWRMAIGLALLLIPQSLNLMFLFLPRLGMLPRLQPRTSTLLGIAAWVGLGAGLLLETNDSLLPGVLIYQEDPSFLRRYEALFTFLGLVIAVSLPFLGWARRSFASKVLPEGPRPRSGRNPKKP